MKDAVVIGLGEILWDIMPNGEKYLGGAPANFAYHVSRLGVPSCVVSAVGDDDLGSEILDFLKSKRLSHYIDVLPFSTGRVLVELDEQGIPSYNICRDVAWDKLSFTPQYRDLAGRASAVCFGSLAQRDVVSRNFIRTFIESVPDGSLRVFDVNLRQDFYDVKVIDWSLRNCDILKLNEEELPVISSLTGMSSNSENDMCKELISKYELDYLILTKGSKGSAVFSPSHKSEIPTPEISVVDTVGAGDAFTAAFVATILKGDSFETAHAVAVKVASEVCCHAGAMPEY